MIEVVLNDRLGKKVRVKCNPDDTIGGLKKLVAAQTGTRPEKIRIQKWYTIYKDHITLADYEIHDGMGLELYYNWVSWDGVNMLNLFLSALGLEGIWTDCDMHVKLGVRRDPWLVALKSH